MSVMVVLLFAGVFLSLLVWSLYIEFVENPRKEVEWAGPNEKEYERLMRQELPAMHGVQQNPDTGEWERF